jgi:glycosyltransferase involved in cell wall biosynthesis
LKISIITVVYNNERTIREAIECVLSQSYNNIEYIIIDGGSSDNTVNIINEYKNKLGYFISEKDKGIYHAMNKGINAATGDIIGILNSDDLYNNNTIIEEIIGYFINNSELDLVYGDLFYVKSENTNNVVRKWVSKQYYVKYFENGNVPPHPSLFVKRKVYEQAGVFNLEFKLAADYEFMLRIFKKHIFTSKYLNKVIVKMRLGGATNQSLSNIKRQNIEILNAWRHNELKPPFLLMPFRLFKRLMQFI